VVEVVVVLVELVQADQEQVDQVEMVDLVVEEDVVLELVVDLELETLHQHHRHKEIMDLLVILVDLELVVVEVVLGEQQLLLV